MNKEMNIPRVELMVFARRIEEAFHLDSDGILDNKALEKVINEIYEAGMSEGNYRLRKIIEKQLQESNIFR